MRIVGGPATKLVSALALVALCTGVATAQISATYDTPGTHAFTVPAGVSEVTIKAWGGGGGGGRNGSKTGAAGGGGGFAQGVYAVSEGDALSITVAGGGAGGSATGSGTGAGGGGGGRSAVSNSTASTLLVVAAGGGGGAGGDNNITFSAGQGVGGAGGGATGIAGGNGDSTTGGAGGTGSEGGTGGTGSLAGLAGSFLAGGDTGDPLGGVGGYGGGGDGGDVNGFAPGAGGGGSGYYGGGGGGSVSSGAGLACGGGGGSSYANPSGTAIANTAGSGSIPGNNGDGDYVVGVGEGGANGAPGENGSNGLVVVSYEVVGVMTFDSPAVASSSITTNSADATVTLAGADGDVTLYWEAGPISGLPADHADWDGTNGPSAEVQGTVTLALTNLVADTLYTCAFYGGSGVWSDPVTFDTAFSDAQAPVFTSAVPAIVSLQLGWQDNASNDTSYVVQRSTNASSGPYTYIDVGLATTLTDTGLLPDTTYYYAIAVTNSDNGSSTLFSLAQTNVTTLSTVERFVATSGSDTVNDGLGWDSPYASLGHALAQGDTHLILVSNGIYNTTAELTVTDPGFPVAIRSYGNGVTGGLANAALTIIDRGGSGSRVFTLNHTDALLDGFTVTGGNASQGGGIYLNSGSVELSIIERNVSLTDGSGMGGGGIYMPSGGDGTVTNCVVRHNRCHTQYRDGGGGGVFAYGGTVTHSQIVDNTNTAGRAGGIWCNGTPVIRNNLVARNVGGGARKSGGIHIRAGNALIESCTVVSNTTDGSGGGIARSTTSFSGSPTIKNCIVYGNTDSGGSSDLQDVLSWVSFTCSPDVTDGVSGNTTADPLLANLAGGDYRPTAASPCIDAGTNQIAWMSGAVDLDGNDRILDGVADIGAFELDVASGPLVPVFTAGATDVVSDADVVFTVTVTGGSGTITDYAWDFGDGNTINGPTLATVTNAYSTPGMYTVSVTVTDDEATAASETNSNYISVWAPNIYVATDSPSPTFPYTSWATAAQDFETVANTAPGDVTITVSNGTYNTSGELVLDSGITIQSYGAGVTGGLANAALTIIDRGGSGSRVFTLSHDSAVLDGLTITGGSGTDGGGVYMSAGLVRHALIQNNASSSDGGGGVYLAAGGSGVVSNCIIRANANTSYNGSRELGGGGVHADGGTVVNCQIVDNTDTGYGAGVWVKNSAIVRNNLIARNASGGRDGGGVYVRSGSPLIESCTIVSNSCLRDIGGLYDYGGTPTIRNCVIAFNTDANGAPQDVLSSPAPSYTCSPDVADGVDGNTTADPLLSDLTGGDYRPTAVSPCIDAGTNQTSWMSGAKDLDGNARILDGVVDIGAFELDVASGPLVPVFTAGATDVVSDANVVFTVTVTGGSGTITDYAWDFGDGNTINSSTLATVTNAYSTPGMYTVSVTVTDDEATEASETKSNYISVWAPNIYVATNSFSSTFPYSTWKTAALDLQSAVASAPDGVTITVSNGTYNTSGEIIIDSAIIIRSHGSGANGGLTNAALTTVDRGGSGSRVFTLSHPDAVLDGFTVTGGNAFRGAGVYLSGGTIQGSVIEANHSEGASAGNGGGGVYIPSGGDGTLSNCLIQANSCNDFNRDSGGGGVYAFGGTITHCRIVDNSNTGGRGGGIWCNGAPTIRNSLVAHNAAGGNKKGGGIYIRGGDALIESCTVVSNTVVGTGGGIARSTYGGNAGIPTIRSCIVYFNTDSGGSSDIQDVSMSWVSYTCSTDTTSGTGNLNADPLLADLAGGDYRLTASSPCNAAGDASAVTWGIDLDGNPRVVGSLDMGAYELPRLGTLFRFQ